MVLSSRQIGSSYGKNLKLYSRCDVLETWNKTTHSPGWHEHTIWYRSKCFRSCDWLMCSELGQLARSLISGLKRRRGDFKTMLYPNLVFKEARIGVAVPVVPGHQDSGGEGTRGYRDWTVLLLPQLRLPDGGGHLLWRSGEIAETRAASRFWRAGGRGKDWWSKTYTDGDGQVSPLPGPSTDQKHNTITSP